MEEKVTEIKRETGISIFDGIFKMAIDACIRHAESGTLKFSEVTCRIPFYCMLLKEIVKFLEGGQPVSLEDALETMAVLDACDRAARSGKTEPVYHI